MLDRVLPAFVVFILFTPIAAQAPNNRDLSARLREEVKARSQIMPTLHVLTDLYGPRLTGSPNAKGAAEWAVKTMGEWGLENGHLEPWEFGHDGWLNERVSAHVIAPISDQLTVEVLAWTPGTNGTVVAAVVQLTPPSRPTLAELTAYLDSMAGNVRDKIVFAGSHTSVPVDLDPPAGRHEESRLQRRYDPAASSADRSQRTAPPQRRGDLSSGESRRLSGGEVSRRIDEFLVANGARLRVNDAGRALGQIVAFNNTSYDLSKTVPTVVMRNEDYGRIARLVADRIAVQLELSIVNRTYPEGRTAYNAIAEIPGTDKRHEIVMLGGHLDSWHAATGATDNAIGCAVVMEVARLLKTLGVSPRRTIRIALWSGEEQGLLGSRAYVREHFGSAEDPKPEYARLSAYLNLDNGTGRVRGATVFGPPAAATVVGRALAAFKDLGVVGAGSTERRVSSTDTATFNAVGLPSINFDQDPIQYESATHHTNLDTYERVIEDDVRASSIVIAAAVYELAMREQLLPRFDRATIPADSPR